MMFIKSLFIISFAIVAIAAPLARPREENGASCLDQYPLIYVLINHKPNVGLIGREIAEAESPGWR